MKKLALRVVIGVGVIALVFTAIMAILARTVKSPADLGVKDGTLAACPNSPNCVSTQSEDPRHQIAPIPYTTSLATARDNLLQVIRSMERSTIITEEATYIHAEFRTKGIGYVDDVEFYLAEDAQVVHFRSSARLPYYDFEVNRKRMETIRTAFMTMEQQ